MKAFVCALLLAILSSSAARADQTIPALADIPPEDPLEISHLIVRGVVESTKDSEFDISSGAPGTTSSLVESVTARVRVLEVLRGTWRDQTITFVGLWDRKALVVGREYVICGSWHAARRTWLTGPHLGIYEKTADDRWEKRQPNPRLASTPALSEAPIAMASLLARIEKGLLGSVTRRSDIIGRGTITSKHVARYVTKDGRYGTMTHYRMAGPEILKGAQSTGEIAFVIPAVDEYVPQWYRFHYPDVEVGQQWLVFLQRSEQGAYPFAARNSLIRIDGDALIYGNAVTLGQTTNEAVRDIRAEVAREQR